MEELRSSVRFPLKLPIEVKEDIDTQHQVETQDISAGGVLFRADHDMAVGSAVEFTINMPAAVLGTPTNVRVHCMGRVVRSQPDDGHRAVAVVIDEYQFERI